MSGFVMPSFADLSSVAEGRGAALIGGLIADPLTISVPSQYATIKDAFDYLRTKTIARGVTVTVQVADGIHDYSGAAVSLNHPQGAQVRVLGNAVTPANCVLTWTNTATGIDALTVTDGHTLGYIDGFHVTRTAHAGASISTGLLADNGSRIIAGPNIKVSNHYYGIAARMGSYIKADAAVVDAAGDVGIWAFVGSAVDCSSAVVANTADPLQSLGYGIQAEYGSSVNCDGAQASANKVAGIAALSGSSVRANGATSSGNTGSGLYARDGGTVEAHGATSSSNGRYGVEELTSGTVEYSAITLSANALGARLAVAQLNADPLLGARVSSYAGPLRVDAGDASPVYVHTAGGLQFEVGHVAGVVSRARARGAAAGAAVIFDCDGAAVDIDTAIRGKGAGAIYLGSQQANYARVNGAPAAGVPAIRAEGSDVDVDLLLAGKGAGMLRWGTHSAGAVATNGYVEWKLADGATVRVAAQRL